MEKLSMTFHHVNNTVSIVKFVKQRSLKLQTVVIDKEWSK